MNNKDLLGFVHNSIVTASQSAYISHDLATYELLGNINAVFSYFTKSMKTVVLHNELQILEKYLHIQKIKYGNRFAVVIPSDESYKDCFIEPLTVIEFFSRILEASLDKYEEEINFTLELDISTVRSVKVILDTASHREIFTIGL